MKKKIGIQIFTTMFIIAVAILPVFAMAQAVVPENPDAPIDGGLSLLIAAGAAYGVKKYRDNRKQKEEDIK